MSSFVQSRRFTVFFAIYVLPCKDFARPPVPPFSDSRSTPPFLVARGAPPGVSFRCHRLEAAGLAVVQQHVDCVAAVEAAGRWYPSPQRGSPKHQFRVRAAEGGAGSGQDERPGLRVQPTPDRPVPAGLR